MKVAVTDAKAQLTELVRLAEAGDDIVLTRHGNPVVRLIPVKQRPNLEQRRRILDSTRSIASSKATSGPDAARSQDFLYDGFGQPG